MAVAAWAEGDLASGSAEDFGRAVERFFDGGDRDHMFAHWQVIEAGAFPQGTLYPAALDLIDIAYAVLADAAEPELAAWCVEVVSFAVRGEARDGRADGPVIDRARRGFWLLAHLVHFGHLHEAEGASELLELLDEDLFARLRRTEWL